MSVTRWTDLPHNVFHNISRFLTTGEIQALRLVDKKANTACIDILFQRSDPEKRFQLLERCREKVSAKINIRALLPENLDFPKKVILICKVSHAMGYPAEPALISEIIRKLFDKDLSQRLEYNDPNSEYLELFSILSDPYTITNILLYLFRETSYSTCEAYLSCRCFEAVEKLRQQKNPEVDTAIENSLEKYFEVNPYDRRESRSLFFASLSAIKKPSAKDIEFFMKFHYCPSKGPSGSVMPLILANVTMPRNPLPSAEQLKEQFKTKTYYTKFFEGIELFSPDQIVRATETILMSVTSSDYEIILRKACSIAPPGSKEPFFEAFIIHSLISSGKPLFCGAKRLNWMSSLSPYVLTRHFTAYLNQFEKKGFGYLVAQLHDYIFMCNQVLTLKQIISFIEVVKKNPPLFVNVSLHGYNPTFHQLTRIMTHLQKSLSKEQFETLMQPRTQEKSEIVLFFPRRDSPTVTHYFTLLMENLKEGEAEILFNEHIASVLNGELIKSLLIPKLTENKSLVSWICKNLKNFNLSVYELNGLISVLLNIPKESWDVAYLAGFISEYKDLYLSEKDALTYFNDAFACTKFIERAGVFRVMLKIVSLEVIMPQFIKFEQSSIYSVIASYEVLIPYVKRDFFLAPQPHLIVKGQPSSRLLAYFQTVRPDYKFVIKLLECGMITEDDLPVGEFLYDLEEIREQMRIQNSLPFKL